MVDITFDHIRSRILRGDFQAGSRIPQDRIAKDLGISRMPLREALRRLEERGFLTITPHRGAFVAAVSPHDVRELYAVRIILESASAAIAAENMDEQRIIALRAILEQAGTAIRDHDGERLADLNREFHLLGHAASGNARMTGLIGDLTQHCQRYRLLHAGIGDRPALALEEHRHILSAWEQHDSRGASYWIEVNLRNSEAALLESLTLNHGPPERGASPTGLLDQAALHTDGPMLSSLDPG